MKWKYAQQLGLIRLVEGGDPGGGGSDPEPEPQGGTPTDPPEPQDPARKAPWTEENFDATRATKLFENLTRDLEHIRHERDKFKKSHEPAETAKLTDLQRAEKERDDAKASGSSLALENARLKAALTHGLTEDDLEFIGGATPEEIAEKAKKYADRHGGGSKPTPTTRPTPRLGGGSDPTVEPDEMDPRKLAELIPRR